MNFPAPSRRLQWRFSGCPINILCFHYSLLLFVPLLLATALSLWAVTFTISYSIFAFFMKKRGFTFPQYMTYLRIKYIDRGQWRAF